MRFERATFEARAPGRIRAKCSGGEKRAGGEIDPTAASSSARRFGVTRLHGEGPSAARPRTAPVVSPPEFRSRLRTFRNRLRRARNRLRHFLNMVARL
jgi:hypothetical protein